MNTTGVAGTVFVVSTLILVSLFVTQWIERDD